MKKVLIVCDYFPPNVYGGAEISTFELAKHLSSKYEVHVFTTRDNNHVDKEKMNYLGIKVFSIISKKSIFFSNYSVVVRPFVLVKFYNFLTKNKFDIIHFNNIGFKLSFSIVLVAKIFKIPSIFTFRDAVAIVNGKFNRGLECDNFKVDFINELRRNKFNFNPFRNFLIRKILQNVTYKIAISNLLNRLLSFNGISIDETYYNRIYFSLDQIDNKVLKNHIVYLGRPSYDKGYFDLVKEMKYLNEKYSINLLILGFDEDDLPTMVLDFIKNNSLNEVIIFKKWIQQDLVFNFISEALLVVFPSRYVDAFGRVILESLLCDTPVLVSRFAGASELITDDNLVFNPFISGDFRSKLDYCLLNNEQIRKDILNSKKDLDLFILNNFNNYYFHIYEKIFKN